MSDRRVKYTKMVLRNALIKLLETKPISRITIKEICEEADINRTTYYAHYTDQFDQLKQIEGEFIEMITARLKGFRPTEDTDIIRMVTEMFCFIDQNRPLCRVLLGGNGNIDFQETFISVVGDYIIAAWTPMLELGRGTAEYVMRFIATGCIGIVTRWLADPSGPTVSELAEIIVAMTNRGIEAYKRK